MPSLLEIVPLKTKMSEMPEPDSPYYVIASDGLFLRRSTAIGIVTQKQKEWPKHLKEADIKTATLKYTAPKIPRRIIDRAWGFFKYALDERGSEAEVLILWNDSTRKYRLFAPHQSCTYSGVDSLYDPGDIPAGYQVIGSIHSHCDFDAFHSGTDTADASDFNGVHITIGHVSNETPSFAAMVMMNGVQWDFDIDAIASISGISPRAFPASWKDTFGTKEEILAREFKTLTKVDLDAWIESMKPKVKVIHHTSSKLPIPRYSTYDDDWNSNSDYMDWWWNNSGNKVKSSSDRFKTPDRRSQVSDSQYSYETRGYVPKDWLTTTGSLKDAYVELAFERKLSELFDAALNRGLWLTFNIDTLTPEEKKRMEVVVTNAPSLTKGEDFLPGPFSVKSDDDRDYSK